MIAELFGLRREPRALQLSGVSLSDPAFWDKVLGDGYESATGKPVTTSGAMTYGPLYQCVTMISGDIAKLPLSLYKRNEALGENGREPDKTHQAYKLVRRQANEEKTAFDFWRTVATHLAIYNHAFAFIDQSLPGRPAALLNLLPDRTCAERIKAKAWTDSGVPTSIAEALDAKLMYTTEVGGKVRTLFPSQVLHFKNFSLDGVDSPDFIQMARDCIAVGLAQQNFTAKFFKNGARMGGVLHLPDGVGKTDRDKIANDFGKTYEAGDNPFKMIVMRDGMKFTAAQVTPEAAQLVEANEEQARMIARFYNVPPSRLGIAGSVSYNSQQEENQRYLDSTLSPWLEMIAAECWLKLLSPSERDNDTHFFEHNTGALLKMNQTDRFAAYGVAITNRILSPNECRAMENRPPYEGGDSFENPNTAKQGPTEGAKPADPPPTEDPPVRSHRLMQIIFGIGARARHKATNPSEFIKWLDDGLTWHRAEYDKHVNDERADELFVPIIADLQRVANTAKASELPAAVDAAMVKHERGE